MKKFRGAIILMVALALLASACGDDGTAEAEADAAAAQAAAAEAQAAEAQAQADAAAAQAAEAQAQADAAAAEAAAAQTALQEAQADLEATQAAAEAGDAEAQAALEAAEMKAEEAAAMASEAEMKAEEASMMAEEAEMALAESMMVEAPEIRAAEVRMGIYPCCADLAYWQIPIELGWWEEWGITITPNQPTYHYFTASQEIVPWLERGDGDVAQGWVPGVFGTLETFGQSIPPIHFADIYVGYAILVAPDSEAKTAIEFMDEGMSFTDAATAAVQQLVGKEVHIPPHSTTQSQYSDAFFAYLPQWWEDVVEDIPALDGEGNPLVLLGRDGTPVLDDAGNPQPIRITTNDWRNYSTPVYVDDPTIVQLSAQAGRIEFAMPYGAPTLVQMMRNGWDPLINFAMMYEHDALSQQTAIASSTVGGTGLLARREWVEENKDLAYRVVAMANRILAYLEDPAVQETGWEIEANIINEKRGLTMEPADIGVIWDTIDPSFNWEDQEALWDLSLPSYHPETVFRTQIEALKARGVLSETYDTQAGLEQFLLAQEIYYDLKGMQDRSDDLFDRASGMDLSASQQALIDQARALYDNYNFYDSLRFLEAALIG
jgi:autotransporter translocation and assembly factor TamB